MNFYSIIIFCIAITMNALANIFMKIGMTKANKISELSISVIFQKMILNIWVILGVLCFGIALLAYNYVLSHIKLSVAYPIMTSVGFVIVVTVSYLFLNEKLEIWQIIGIVLITIGVWFVASGIKS